MPSSMDPKSWPAFGYGTALTAKACGGGVLKAKNCAKKVHMYRCFAAANWGNRVSPIRLKSIIGLG